jgi:hypothetical protein
MPWGATPNFRSRAFAVACVVGGHVAVLVLLVAQHERAGRELDDRRMTLVFVDALPETPPRTGRVSRPARAPRPARVSAVPQAPDSPASPAGSAIAPGIDWYSQGSQAAARTAAEPTTRSFDFPKREPAPREKKAFGWDKTHTERVHALEGGGIGIHLNDNCELVIAPFPMAGCALGKRKARGDLFDEMKAPPEMGDWKEK